MRQPIGRRAGERISPGIGGAFHRDTTAEQRKDGPMIRFLLHAAINLVLSAVALLVASLVVDGVVLEWRGVLIAIAVFTVAQAVLAPFVFNMARKYASAVLGGVGLVSTLLALWVATLFSGGLQIHGTTAWFLTPLLVWVITALGTWILGALVINRWWERRVAEKKARSVAARIA